MSAAVTGAAFVSKTRPCRITWYATGLEIANRLQTLVGVGFKRTTGAPATYADLVESDWSDLLGWDLATIRATADNTFAASVKGGFDPSNISSAEVGDHAYLFVMQGVSSPEAGSGFDSLKAIGVLRT